VGRSARCWGCPRLRGRAERPGTWIRPSPGQAGVDVAGQPERGELADTVLETANADRRCCHGEPNALVQRLLDPPGEHRPREVAVSDKDHVARPHVVQGTRKG